MQAMLPKFIGSPMQVQKLHARRSIKLRSFQHDFETTLLFFGCKSDIITSSSIEHCSCNESKDIYKMSCESTTSNDDNTTTYQCPDNNLLSEGTTSSSPRQHNQTHPFSSTSCQSITSEHHSRSLALF